MQQAKRCSRTERSSSSAAASLTAVLDPIPAGTSGRSGGEEASAILPDAPSAAAHGNLPDTSSMACPPDIGRHPFTVPGHRPSTVSRGRGGRRQQNGGAGYDPPKGYGLSAGSWSIGWLRSVPGLLRRATRACGAAISAADPAAGSDGADLLGAQPPSRHLPGLPGPTCPSSPSHVPRAPAQDQAAAGHVEAPQHFVEPVHPLAVGNRALKRLQDIRGAFEALLRFPLR